MNKHAQYIFDTYNCSEPWNAQKLVDAADEIIRLEKELEGMKLFIEEEKRWKPFLQK